MQFNCLSAESVLRSPRLSLKDSQVALSAARLASSWRGEERWRGREPASLNESPRLCVLWSYNTTRRGAPLTCSLSQTHFISKLTLNSLVPSLTLALIGLRRSSDADESKFSLAFRVHSSCSPSIENLSLSLSLFAYQSGPSGRSLWATAK